MSIRWTLIGDLTDMIIALGLGDTATETVTDTSADYSQGRPYTAAIVLSERVVHLAVGRAATTDDFKLQADTYFVVQLSEDETLNYILADGESDGEIRITAATN